MNSRSLLVLCTLLFSLNATAQSLNRLEVFGGYQHLGYYTYQGEEGPWSETGYNGFEASAAYRLLPHFSAEADFGFEKGPGPSAFGLGIQTYLGGPRRVSAQNGPRSTAMLFSADSGSITPVPPTRHWPLLSAEDSTFGLPVTLARSSSRQTTFIPALTSAATRRRATLPTATTAFRLALLCGSDEYRKYSPRSGGSY
jgi:hypothetical protein